MEIDEVLKVVPTFSKVTVAKRQTTYLDLDCVDSTRTLKRTFRIHYDKKHEFRLRAKEIQSITLEIEHPLLLQYHQPICPLQLVSDVADRDCFLEKLDAVTYEVFHGWREAVDYCFMPPEKFIEKGYGILMEAPKAYIDEVVQMANACGATLVSGKPREPNGPLAKVLIMDNMYVVADGFRVVELS